MKKLALRFLIRFKMTVAYFFKSHPVCFAAIWHNKRIVAILVVVEEQNQNKGLFLRPYWSRRSTLVPL